MIELAETPELADMRRSRDYFKSLWLDERHQRIALEQWKSIAEDLMLRVGRGLDDPTHTQTRVEIDQLIRITFGPQLPPK